MHELTHLLNGHVDPQNTVPNLIGHTCQHLACGELMRQLVPPLQTCQDGFVDYGR